MIDRQLRGQRLVTRAWRYGLGLAAGGLAAAPWLLSGRVVDISLLLVFLAAVAFAVPIAGAGPGLVTAAIGAGVAIAVDRPGPHAGAAIDARLGLQLGLYVLIAVTICALSAAMRRRTMEGLDETSARQVEFADALTRNLGEGLYAIDRN